MDATPADPLASDPVAGEGSPRAHRLAVPGRPYTVTVTVEGAPGPFEAVSAFVQYDIANYQQCGKYNSDTGTRMPITASESFPLEKISNTKYRGTFYLDLMRDEDFFGNGVCHWGLTQMSTRLKATGAHEDTRFLPYLPKESITSQESRTLYFWSGYYPRAKNSDNYPEFGDKNLDSIPESHRSEFFKITLTTKEGTP